MAPETIRSKAARKIQTAWRQYRQRRVDASNEPVDFATLYRRSSAGRMRDELSNSIPFPPYALRAMSYTSDREHLNSVWGNTLARDHDHASFLEGSAIMARSASWVRRDLRLDWEGVPYIEISDSDSDSD